MTIINANTKIAFILKQHPDALEAIISISPKFNKLRNPLLRKLMASRTTISMASKIGGCSVEDFFRKLQPLGFTIDRTVSEEKSTEKKTIPQFMNNVQEDKVSTLDVRSVINSGKDPLNLILESIKQLQTGQVLKLINSFEPVPLIQLLGKQGFESHLEIINENTVFTYFFKSAKAKDSEPERESCDEDWDEILQRFKKRIVTIDVRQMEMPLPMLTILDELEKLPIDNALYVYHKRIPVFLLPELKEKKFEYRIKEISDAEVHLLIFKL